MRKSRVNSFFFVNFFHKIARTNKTVTKIIKPLKTKVINKMHKEVWNNCLEIIVVKGNPVK